MTRIRTSMRLLPLAALLAIAAACQPATETDTAAETAPPPVEETAPPAPVDDAATTNADASGAETVPPADDATVPQQEQPATPPVEGEQPAQQPEQP